VGKRTRKPVVYWPRCRECGTRLYLRTLCDNCRDLPIVRHVGLKHEFKKRKRVLAAEAHRKRLEYEFHHEKGRKDMIVEVVWGGDTRRLGKPRFRVSGIRKEPRQKREARNAE